MRAAIFGAGNIGRGLVGEALSDSGYSLTFIDADEGIVRLLAETRQYGVTSKAGDRTIYIDSVVNAADEAEVQSAVAEADVIATAVGPAVLKIVAPAIGGGLATRSRPEVNVIACENVHPNSTALRSHVIESCGDEVVAGVGFPNVVVDRIVPGAPGAPIVEVEAGFEFVVDRDDWVGSTPDTGPIVFTTNLDAYKLRKLWLVNGLHVVAAWLGIQAGYEYVHEAMADPSVRATVGDVGAAMAKTLATRTGEFGASDLESYCAQSLSRFSDTSLPDRTLRVARNPLAKLAADERVLAPANAAESIGVDTAAFADAIAAALRLAAPGVEGLDQLHEELNRTGWQDLMVGHGGVARDGSLYSQLEERMTQPDTDRGITLITEEIVITNPAGLHARPAAEIVEAAKASEAEVQIRKGEKAANAKSIMSVLALGANTGDTVQLTVEGAGADDVVESLRRIMQSEEH